MKTSNLNMSWSLEKLYSSFKGDEFQKDLKILDKEISELKQWSEENLNNSDKAALKLEQYINKMKSYRSLSGKLTSYASLTLSADANNGEAEKYLGVIEEKTTELTEVTVKFAKWLNKVENLETIVASSPLLKEHQYYLKEILKKSKYLLSEKEEVVISKMKLTGSNSWANLKNQLASNLMVDIEIKGEKKLLGINKIKNMAFSNDKELRKNAHYAEAKSNEKIAAAVAASLNGIKGEVNTLCELKGYSSALHKTLEDSRMDELTLNTMLKVMKDNLGEFQRYFLKKAQLLGYSRKLPYYDIMAPVGNKKMEYTYEEAKEFIVKHFTSFRKEMGELAENAFDNRWIDAEVREGKRGGAFCHNLHPIKESRILCSYSGSFKNVCTLAHELGHGYHGMILQKESILNSSYPMPLAETASIFSEGMVRNAALKEADKEEALVILGAELVNCASVIVDIYARFIFEKELFNRRKSGSLDLEEIKEIMVASEKEAYGNAIDENTLDPYAWLHKPHYYYAERNYYNFPYAFGLLFSKGLYKLYLEEGSSFVEKYNEVLRLSAQADVYDVAKSVGIDLHDESFWQGSMEMIKKDIDKFCSIDL